MSKKQEGTKSHSAYPARHTWEISGKRVDVAQPSRCVTGLHSQAPSRSSKYSAVLFGCWATSQPTSILKGFNSDDQGNEPICKVISIMGGPCSWYGTRNAQRGNFEKLLLDIHGHVLWCPWWKCFGGTAWWQDSGCIICVWKHTQPCCIPHRAIHFIRNQTEETH